ncbi:helix-turn-helix domain-containing protein [Streptomyces sp. NPDC004647]|uniref:helix-turn-helix domain-containing protein n=1 Tax=Streptomyces sp. NPDC004647 TaxID=3154671 RepID=UPI0033ADD2F8
MPTLGYLVGERTELQLRFAEPGHPTVHAGNQVTGVVTLNLSDLATKQTDYTQTANALVLVRLTSPPLKGASAAAIDRALRHLAHHQAAGLALAVPAHSTHIYPAATRGLASRLRIPLLTTTAPPTSWEGANVIIQQSRAQCAERQVKHLNGLLSRLPAQLADHSAIQHIAEWLAGALDGQVLVSEPERGVLAAAPRTAPADLAHAVISQAVDATQRAASAEQATAHTRLVSISPGTGNEAVLAVASRTAFDSASASLVQHAARLIGLVDQACNDHRVALEDARGVRHAVFQLLMVGESVKAQRAFAGLAPGLLDSDMARVYVIDCGIENREPTLRRCESTLAGRALVTLCPGKADHVLIVDPTPDGEYDSIAADLRRLIANLDDHLMGGSQRHPLARTADAYVEAFKELRKAAHEPDRVKVAEPEAKLAPILDRHAARAWAERCLAQIMKLRRSQREQLLETLPVALPFSYNEAAGILGVHRNTVRERVKAAAELLSLDLSSLINQIPVLLALDILTLPEPSEHPGSGEVHQPDLAELLTTPEVKEWADQLLQPVRSDHRDLVHTACVWLENESNLERTARALEKSVATVRSHIRAMEELIRQDLTPDAIGVQDLALALFIATGRPALTQPHPGARHLGSPTTGEPT